MSGQQPFMPPQSEPFPGSRTPGWNDPPNLQYNPLNASGTNARPRINLNKRVAFPLQGTVPATGSIPPKPTAVVQPNQALSFMGPPPMAAVPPMVTPQGTASGSTTAHPIAVVHPTVMGAITQSDHQEQIIRTLKSQIVYVYEDAPNKKEEIGKRLDIIGQLWQSGALSSEVQVKLMQLSKAIEEKNYTSAMDCYGVLATNHSIECSSWIVALRHLVLTLQPDAASGVTTPGLVSLVPGVPRTSAGQSSESAPYNPIQHI